MCFISGKKVRVYLYHSLEEKHGVEFCSNQEFLDTKYDLAILYVNMRYFIFPVDNLLVEEKGHFGVMKTNKL